jgi:hypothetical protein
MQWEVPLRFGRVSSIYLLRQVLATVTAALHQRANDLVSACSRHATATAMHAPTRQCIYAQALAFFSKFRVERKKPSVVEGKPAQEAPGR